MVQNWFCYMLVRILMVITWKTISWFIPVSKVGKVSPETKVTELLNKRLFIWSVRFGKWANPPKFLSDKIISHKVYGSAIVYQGTLKLQFQKGQDGIYSEFLVNLHRNWFILLYKSVDVFFLKFCPFFWTGTKIVWHRFLTKKWQVLIKNSKNIRSNIFKILVTWRWIVNVSIFNIFRKFYVTFFN